LRFCAVASVAALFILYSFLGGKKMKKFTALFLVLVMCFSMVACNDESESEETADKETAFDVAKEAYDKIAVAYEITEKFGSDVYEAWRLGIYEDDEILDDGVGHLASELSLSESEIIAGVALVLADEGEEPETLTKSTANFYFNLFEEDLFSFCVMVVSEAYEANGKITEAQNALDSAKNLMKKMSEKYSDYEHYPNLKEYYTTTKSFFAFCQDPTGSFEQIKTTINDYKNDARNYVSDLDYIFED
jgi:hypothetical protein